ncbi:NAD(P)-binding protein [Artomyces pyxidatus]|uniref:NAD(P)-binding protein n=1 Tax=Artomyces pyxidatus TaxID=48021 RepID=A0ACB8SP81_9AGAM|nr:NAD(P)-binding protein [Artomyces pyxidatus]
MASAAATANDQLVWLITGCATGIGRELTLEALGREDKVIATARARSIAKLDDLKQRGAEVLELDVPAAPEVLNDVAKQAIAFYGRVDVVINNAGYMMVGAIEESTAEETFAQFNTNVFCAVNVTRAFLPHWAMRARESGTIIWFGSIASWTALPGVGLYAATKVVNRLLGETLHNEISALGLRSLVVEPGYFRTAFLADGNRGADVPRIGDYAQFMAPLRAHLEETNGKQLGDPAKLVKTVADAVRGEGFAETKSVPSLYLGSDTVQAIRNACNETLQYLEQWENVFKSTDFTE